MRYTTVYLPGSLNESGVAVFMVVDTDPGGGASQGQVVARSPDSIAAFATAAALNENPIVRE